MSDQQAGAEEQAAPKYPNSFLFGASVGVTIQATMRQYTHEPLAARPLSYLRFALLAGGMIWYWDYRRRCALENVLQREERFRYFQTVQSLNMHMRVGDEDATGNLTEYLAGSTTRI